MYADNIQITLKWRRERRYLFFEGKKEILERANIMPLYFIKPKAS